MSVTPIPREERLDELPVYLTGPVAPGWWGTLFFIATEAMLFGSLIAGLFYLRTTVGVPTEQLEPPKLQLPLLNTLLLLTSSVALAWGEHGIRKGNSRRLRAGLLLTLLLGAAFLVVQAIEYSMKPPPTTDAYHGLFFTITGLHGSHVFTGLVMITFLLVQSLRGRFDERRHQAVGNVGRYWHFVDAVWLTIMLTIYLWPYLT